MTKAFQFKEESSEDEKKAETKLTIEVPVP